MTKRGLIKLLSAAMAMAVFDASGQSSDWNYVMTIEAGAGSVLAPSADDVGNRVSIEYVDGLGRPVQQVIKRAGGQGEDIISLIEYDLSDNVSHRWLPVGVNGGGAAMDYDSFKQAAYNLYGSDQRPYTMTLYEDKMNGRPVSVHRPGKEYKTRAVTTEYAVTAQQVASCLLFKVISSGTGESLTCAGCYSPGTLRSETGTDEDGNQTQLFKDRSERTILQRRYLNDGSTCDTYWVYDNRGLLRYVISPEASRLIQTGETVDNILIENLCFKYDYDVRKRLVSEQNPGAAPIYYVYDKLGNKIFSQNGNQRTRSEWSVFKYDNRHRLAIEGRCKIPGATRESLQSEYGNRLLTETKSIDNSNEYRLLYTNNNGPSGFEALRSYVYDDYSHWNGFITQQPVNTYLQTEMARSAMGMLTGGAINDEGVIYHQAIVYDPYGRVIAECERECFLNAAGYARYYTYNYRGILTHKKTEYQSYGEQMLLDSHCVEWRYSHDGGDRVTKIEYSVDGGQWREQTSQTYDYIGRLSSKTLGDGNTGVITYSHDLQGRLTEITGPWYSQRLYYTSNPFDPSATISYNGNISSSHDTMWKTFNGSTSQSALKFSHSYDRLNRLTRSYDNHSGGLFMEEMDYDLNGNIMSLVRDFDGDRVQDLTIVRDGNKIVSVYDVSDDSRIGEVPQIPSGDYLNAVEYDANGNVTRDATRAVTKITYHDYLNLPKIITVNGKSNIHRYRPDGVKTQDRETRTVMTTVTSVDSLGNTVTTLKPTNKTTLRQYTGDFINTGAQTWEVPTEDGHLSIDYSNNVMAHHYYVRDYLGSTRAVIDDAGNLLQTVNYYPSGVPFTLTDDDPVTDRLHTGKPFIDMQGLGYYDNNARFLDILTGSFISIDPLAGKFPDLSPYSHCANNPLSYIDPDGDSIAVLNLGGIIGHSAMLIQDENNKWRYYSMNGDNLYRATNGIVGGKPHHDKGTKTFNSPKEFLLSPYNEQGTDEQVQKDEVNNFGYSSAYIIPTTLEQDRLVETEFLRHTSIIYNPLTHQCAQVVRDALVAAGIDVSTETVRNIDSMTKIGYITIKTRPNSPQSVFNAVIKNNPNGILLRK